MLHQVPLCVGSDLRHVYDRIDVLVARPTKVLLFDGSNSVGRTQKDPPDILKFFTASIAVDDNGH